MGGTGFNYIREIMAMNLPDESTPEALKEYEREEKGKKFHYIGLTPYKPFDHNCKVMLMPPGMAGVIAVNKDELLPVNASVNDVVQHCGRLFVYTEKGIWSHFVPGPCTNYDGPNPYKKTIYTSTSAVYDSPIAEAIRENLKKSLDMAGVLGPCEIERVSDTEIVAKYDVKYIGETFTDVRKNPDIQSVWLQHPIRVYNQVRHTANIGEAVKWDGQIYVWNGNQWVEFPKQEKVALGWPVKNKEVKSMAFEYHKIPANWLSIEKVIFNDPATIVFWADGTKTVVTCGDNDVYDPEKGLVMAVAKKAFGNQGNYYNQIKKWLPEEDEAEESTCDITWSIREAINGVFGDPKRVNAAKKLTAIQELIVGMTFEGATKGELVRAIRFSKDLIDASKGADVDITKSVAELGIAELEAKYQPKK